MAGALFPLALLVPGAVGGGIIFGGPSPSATCAYVMSGFSDGGPMGDWPFDPLTCLELSAIENNGQAPATITHCIGDDSHGVVSGTDPGMPYIRARYNTSCGVDFNGLWMEMRTPSEDSSGPGGPPFRRLQAQHPPQPTCWGDVASGQGAWPSGAGFLETFSVGLGFACGVFTNGIDSSWDNMTRDVRCWGSGPGASVPANVTVPPRLEPLSEDQVTATRRRRGRCCSPQTNSVISAAKLAAGGGHACVSVYEYDYYLEGRRLQSSNRRRTWFNDKRSGYLACWGENGFGQADICKWRPPWYLAHFAENPPSWFQNSTDGCFGGHSAITPEPGYFPYGVSALALGLKHTCVNVQNYIQCWGDNSYGQLDSPYRENQFFGNLLVAGDYHTCGNLWEDYDGFRRLDEEEDERRLGGLSTRFVCWGSNSAGQTNVPVDLQGQVIVAAAGAEHTCAYATMPFGPRRQLGGIIRPIIPSGPGGVLLCWGSNSHGQTAIAGVFDFILNVEATDRGTCYTGFPTTTRTTTTVSTSTLTTSTSTATLTVTTSSTTSTSSTVSTSTTATSTVTTSTGTTITETTATVTTATMTTVTETETSTETASTTSTSTDTSTSTASTTTVTSTDTTTSTATTTTSTATTTTATGTSTSTVSTTISTVSTTTLTATTVTSTVTTTGTATVTSATATSVTSTETSAIATGTTTAAAATAAAPAGMPPATAAPAASPVLTPTASPVFTPAASPVLAPATSPVFTPAASPVLAPAAAPTLAKVASPVLAPAASPVLTTVTETTTKTRLPTTVTETTTKAGVKLRMSFSGVDCSLVMSDVAMQASFIAAVEDGIIASISSAAVTKQHITTRVFCKASGRRLQSGGALDSESVIDAQAAQVPVAQIQSSLDTARTSGTMKSNVETCVRKVERIATVTVTGKLPTVGQITEISLVDPGTSTGTTTTVTTATVTTRAHCDSDICVTWESAASRDAFAAGVLMVASLGVLRP